MSANAKSAIFSRLNANDRGGNLVEADHCGRQRAVLLAIDMHLQQVNCHMMFHTLSGIQCRRYLDTVAKLQACAVTAVIH